MRFSFTALAPRVRAWRNPRQKACRAALNGVISPQAAGIAAPLPGRRWNVPRATLITAAFLLINILIVAL
jgi:hypothetical protein